MGELRDNFIKRLKNVKDLPTLPIVMSKLSKVMDDPDCHAKNIENVLSSDPAIAMQLLKTVNSPLYASRGAKVADLHTAVMRLGFREVKNIALSTSVFKMFDGIKSELFDRTSFWKHCIACSQAAIELGRIADRKLKRDELHLAGLVHDIGKIVLDSNFAEEFEKCLRLSYAGKVPLFEAEKVVLGLDHSEIGFIIAEKWNLPEYAISAIKYHHIPKETPEKHQKLVDIIHIANYIVNSQDYGTSGDFVVPVFDKEVLNRSGLTAEDLQGVVNLLAEREDELVDSIF